MNKNFKPWRKVMGKKKYNIFALPDGTFYIPHFNFNKAKAVYTGEEYNELWKKGLINNDDFYLDISANRYYKSRLLSAYRDWALMKLNEGWTWDQIDHHDSTEEVYKKFADKWRKPSVLIKKPFKEIKNGDEKRDYDEGVRLVGGEGPEAKEGSQGKKGDSDGSLEQVRGSGGETSGSNGGSGEEELSS